MTCRTSGPFKRFDAGWLHLTTDHFFFRADEIPVAITRTFWELGNERWPVPKCPTFKSTICGQPTRHGSGIGPFLFPSDKNPSGHHKNLKTAWRKTLKRAGVPYFRIYDLRSTYATRLRAGGGDEWVTQLLRQGDAKVFKKYSQMKLQMKREALEKMNRQANEMPLDSGTATIQ